MPNLSRRDRSRLLVVVAALLWSTSGFYAKAPWFDDWPMETRGVALTFWRAVFAALTVLPFVRRPQFRIAMVPMSMAFVAMTYSFLVAMVVLSMILTPLSVWIGNKLLETTSVEEEPEEDFQGAQSTVLMIGFSRMGQVAAQALLASGKEVTVIDNNPNIIKQAAKFGFRIYFGNGSRKDVLIAAGIQNAKLVCVTTHTPEITNRIVDLIASEFPEKAMYVRAYDRAHTLQLMDKKVKYQIRETFESALALGNEMLKGLGHEEEEIQEILENVRHLDQDRLMVQYREGMYAGLDILHTKPDVQPEPLVKPQHPATALDERSSEVLEEEILNDTSTESTPAE